MRGFLRNSLKNLGFVMGRRRKRPSLENYLTTGKVHWEGEPDISSPFQKGGCEVSEASLPPERISLTEKEERFLSMLETKDREFWEPRFRKSFVSFFPLQVMKERSSFEKGERKGKILKLRRRKYPLEEVKEEKDISFPLLALLEEKENILSIRSNHIES